MKWQQRPGFRELETKLLQARRCIEKNQCLFAPAVDKLIDEFMSLKIDQTSEIWSLLQQLLLEIKPEDFAMKALEEDLQCELFSFVWESKKMKCNMCLKFAIKDNQFYYFSLQKNKRRRIYPSKELQSIFRLFRYS